MELFVSRDGFATISEAIASCMDKVPMDERVIICVSPGIYRERLEIRRPNVTLKGLAAPEDTVIVCDHYANERMEDGSKRGTFRSYVLLLDGDGCRLENLTIRNEAYPRSKVGQAVALYADGDGIEVKNCHLESYQDTLFTGPLPPTPMTPGGFTGPKEFDERKMGRQRYENCVIRGDVDFIFGSAAAYFKNCDVISLNALTEADQAPESGILGYVTAASTPEGWPVGYVFEDCRFLSEGCPPCSVYLGRPWRNFAKTVLIHCELGVHVHPAGFHDWNKPDCHETITYGECASYGPGADPSRRADYVRQVSADEARRLREYFENIRVEGTKENEL